MLLKHRPPKNLYLANSVEVLNRLRTALSTAVVVGFDTESHGPKLYDSKFINMYHPDTKLTGYSVAFEYGDVYYVPLSHNVGNAPHKQALDCLGVVLSKGVWAHNWNHDSKAIGKIPALCYDSMLLSWLCQISEKGYGLKSLVEELYGYPMASFQQTTKGQGFNEIDPKEGYKYACEDAWYSLCLGKDLEPIAKRLGVWKSFIHQEMEFLRVIRHMEDSGMLLDIDNLSKLRKTIESKLTRLKAEWDFHFPCAISSPKQVAEYFYGNKLWKPGAVGKSGVPSVNKVAMEAQLSGNTVGAQAAILRLEYQLLQKNFTTYTEAYIERAAQYPDKRIHPSILQHGTETGRISMSNPNLMQIPTRSEMGRMVKDCFVAASNHTLVVADYSQIELRVLAHFAGGALLNAYLHGEDVHQQTADFVGCSRDQGKTGNFAYVYGAGPKKLAQTLNMTYEQALDFIKKYEKAYPEVVTLRKDVVRAAERRGFVKTLSGRIRRIYGINKEGAERWSAERKAFNTVIQGGASDIVKKAMISFFNEGLPNVKIICQVHDEIVLEVPDNAVESITRCLKDSMENAFNLRCPLLAEVGHGKTWLKAKE